MSDVDNLRNAELLYKFSLAISSTCAASETSPFDYLRWFTYFGHAATEEELCLTLAQEKWASAVFEHVAIYLMAVQIDTALEAKFGSQRFDNTDSEIRAACSIARLIRNAFAHDPFGPTWEFTPKFANQTFEVEGILLLDTTCLQKKPVKQRHYGGPLALLRFLQFTIKLIEGAGEVRDDLGPGNHETPS